MKNETQLNTEIKTENQSYIVLPTFLLKNLDLTAMELIFFADIMSLCAAGGFCWALNTSFARKYSVTENTVSKWVSTLVNKQLITRQLIYYPGTKNVQERRIFLNTENPTVAGYLNWYRQFSGKSDDTLPCDTPIPPLPADDTPVITSEGTPIITEGEDNNKFMNNKFGINLNQKNISLSQQEYDDLVSEHCSASVDQALNEYSSWKYEKHAHPKSDFLTLSNWLMRKGTHRPSTRKPRLSAIQELGLDRVTPEMLAAVPF